MLCSLCYVVLCYVVLCYVVLWYVMLGSVMLCHVCCVILGIYVCMHVYVVVYMHWPQLDLQLHWYELAPRRWSRS